jgi:hypothetical protein
VICVLGLSTTSPLKATADVIAFGADGTARTSGWTFHGVHPNWAASTNPTDQEQFEPPVPAQGATPYILTLIHQTSTRHRQNRAIARAGLAPQDWHSLFQAMIEAESGYNPTAISAKGAFGLGQLMPATARDLGVNPREISQNLDGAARYLLAQLDEFGGVDLALAAYNAGPQRVVAFSGVPPFAETRDYIARIHRIRTRLSRPPASNQTVRVATKAAKRTPVVIDLN